MPTTPPKEIINDDPTRQPPTPLRCILGAIVAGFIGSLMWKLTNSIVWVFFFLL